jgi:hypothetical protein
MKLGVTTTVYEVYRLCGDTKGAGLIMDVKNGTGHASLPGLYIYRFHLLFSLLNAFTVISKTMKTVSRDSHYILLYFLRLVLRTIARLVL